MKEEFNIEKWRKENPVDYIKAIRLILSETETIVKNYMFMQIYKVMQLYIPNDLYKYYSLDDNEEMNTKKLQTLSEGKIFMCEPKNFNDPFDDRAFFYESKELADIERLKKSEGKIIDNFSDFFRVASLTGNDYNSMPMWAHYANNHCGYCVCYDMKNDKNRILKSNTFQIQYVDERINITSFMYKYFKMIADKIDENKEKGVKVTEIEDISVVYISCLLSNLKHSSWKYENEFRCSFGKKGDKNSYCDAIPKEIYIGMKCDIKNEEKLVNIAQKFNIPVYKMNYVVESTGFILKPEKIIYK